MTISDIALRSIMDNLPSKTIMDNIKVKGTERHEGGSPYYLGHGYGQRVEQHHNLKKFFIHETEISDSRAFSKEVLQWLKDNEIDFEVISNDFVLLCFSANHLWLVISEIDDVLFRITFPIIPFCLLFHKENVK